MMWFTCIKETDKMPHPLSGMLSLIFV